MHWLAGLWWCHQISRGKQTATSSISEGENKKKKPPPLPPPPHPDLRLWTGLPWQQLHEHLWGSNKTENRQSLFCHCVCLCVSELHLSACPPVRRRVPPLITCQRVCPPSLSSVTAADPSAAAAAHKETRCRQGGHLSVCPSELLCAPVCQEGVCLRLSERQRQDNVSEKEEEDKWRVWAHPVLFLS